MKIVEIRGRAQVFTLKDGSTLRLFARESKKVDERNISDELHIAKTLGLVLFIKEDPKKNKKSGGTK